MGYFNKLNTGYHRSEEMPIKQRQCVTSLHPNECILSIDDWTCASCKALQPAPVPVSFLFFFFSFFPHAKQETSLSGCESYGI